MLQTAYLYKYTYYSGRVLSSACGYQELAEGVTGRNTLRRIFFGSSDGD
jgi:hypothetical protein